MNITFLRRSRRERYKPRKIALSPFLSRLRCSLAQVFPSPNIPAASQCKSVVVSVLGLFNYRLIDKAAREMFFTYSLITSSLSLNRIRFPPSAILTLFCIWIWWLTTPRNFVTNLRVYWLDFSVQVDACSLQCSRVLRKMCQSRARRTSLNHVSKLVNCSIILTGEKCYWYESVRLIIQT